MQNDQIQTIKPGAIFIGDAHAGASRPQFLKFLRALHSAQSLPPQIFMMGDMFDFLANTTYVQRFYEEEIALINELSRKCEIFYFEGNHDFNLREIFPRAKVYPNAAQPVKFICESGETVQIAHGDLFLPRLTQFALLSLRNRAFLKFMDLLDRALKFKRIFMQSNMFENQEIIDIDVEESIKTSYLDYSMSVIIGRALPDARDGLKPVHRRILYAMNDLGVGSRQPYKKSARIVGDVIGKYHPHGDTAVYDALVRMAQSFSMRIPSVDGQGNFGSIDGDGAAAMRYTEARMTPLAEELLKDLDKETVDFVPNYDESLNEPDVLPARVPNLLLNGSSGIAVGMATNIPPHSLDELVGGLLILLENKNASLEEIMGEIKGPDFPTGGIIYGKKGIIEAYKTGRGRVKIRAKTHIEKKASKDVIVIDELPYQT